MKVHYTAMLMILIYAVAFYHGRAGRIGRGAWRVRRIDTRLVGKLARRSMGEAR